MVYQDNKEADSGVTLPRGQRIKTILAIVAALLIGGAIVFTVISGQSEQRGPSGFSVNRHDTRANRVQPQPEVNRETLGLMYAQRAELYAENGQDFYAALTMARAVDFQGYGNDNAETLINPEHATRFMQELNPVQELWQAIYDRHAMGKTMSAMLSMPGNLAVTGHETGEVAVWDISTGEMRHAWDTGGNTMREVTISADESTVMAMDATAAYFWKMDGGLLTQTIEIPQREARAVFLSANGSKLITGGDDGLVKIWDTTNGEHVQTLGNPGTTVWSVAMSSDMQHLAWGDDAGMIRWVSLKADAETVELKQHMGAVFALAFHPDSMILASGGYDTKAILWDLQSGESQHVLTENNSEIRNLRFQLDGEQLMTGTGASVIRTFNTKDGKFLKNYNVGVGWLLAIGYSADGAPLALGEYSQTGKPLLRKMLARSKETLHLHGDELLAVTFSPDGQRLAVARQDKKLLVYEAWTGELIQTLDTELLRIETLAFSPDNTRLAAGARSQLQHWTIETGEASPVIKVRADDAIVFAKNNKMLVTSGSISASTVNLETNKIGIQQHTQGYNITDLKLVNHDRTVIFANSHEKYRWTLSSNKRTRLKAFAHPYRRVKLSNDGKDLGYMTTNSSIRIHKDKTDWGLELGQLQQTQLMHLRLSGDGSQILTATDDNRVQIWNTVKESQTLMQIDQRDDRIRDIAISDDARLAAVVGDDGILRVWHVDHGIGKRNIPSTADAFGNSLKASVIAYSPDGQTMAVLYGGYIAQLRSVDNGDLIKAFKPLRFRAFHAHFSADAEHLFLLDQPGSIYRLPLNQDEAPVLINEPVGPITSVSYSGDGKWAAVTTMDIYPRLINLETGEIQKYRGSEHLARDIQFLTDQEHFVSLSSHGFIRFWKIGVLDPFMSFRHQNATKIAISPNGQILVSGDRAGNLRFWDIQTGELKHERHAHELGVSLLNFSADGQTLMSYGDDQWLRFWNPAGEQTQAIHVGMRITDLMLSPNGEELAFIQRALPREIEIWTRPKSAANNLYQYIQSGAYAFDGINVIAKPHDGPEDPVVKQFIID